MLQIGLLILATVVLARLHPIVFIIMGIGMFLALITAAVATPQAGVTVLMFGLAASVITLGLIYWQILLGAVVGVLLIAMIVAAFSG